MSSEPGRRRTEAAAARGVTVVVVTRDRAQQLRQSLPQHEAPVLLVDNGSNDETVRMVRQEFSDVVVLPLGRNAGSAGRNVGVRRARTPFVAFADDDSWWAPGALDRAASLLSSRPDIGLVAARVVVGDGGRDDPMSVLMRKSPLGTADGMPGPDVVGFLACAAMVRRDAYLDAGGFDEVVFFAGEEERLALDLWSRGWRCVYVDELVVHHHPSAGRGDGRARAALIARNTILTAVMRRPWSVVGARVHAVWSDPTRRPGIRAAAWRLPAALRARRRVSEQVERRVRAVEASES
jgi:GT2 family glycosyltransferase